MGERMPKNGGGKGWVTDPDTGEKIMPDLWKGFLVWLLTYPRDPVHQYQWAEANGCHEDSLRRIKRDPRFIAEWERQAATTNASVEKVQAVVDALWFAASKGDAKAAALYLQYVEKFTPKRRLVVDDEREVTGLSNDELRTELRELVDELA